MSDIKLQEEINKGVEADRILNNPVYKDAIADHRQAILNAMRSVAMGDREAHTRLVLMYQNSFGIEQNLKSYMQTGQMAKIQVSGGAVQKIRGIA